MTALNARDACEAKISRCRRCDDASFVAVSCRRHCRRPTSTRPRSIVLFQRRQRQSIKLADRYRAIKFRHLCVSGAAYQSRASPPTEPLASSEHKVKSDHTDRRMSRRYIAPVWTPSCSDLALCLRLFYLDDSLGGLRIGGNSLSTNLQASSVGRRVVDTSV